MGKFISGVTKTLNNINADTDNREFLADLLKDTSSVVTAATALASSNKLNKGMITASLAVSAYSLARGFHNLYRVSNRPKTFDINIDSFGDLYPIAMDWVMETYHISARDAIDARVVNDDSRRRSASRRDASFIKVATSVSGSFQHTMDFNGISVIATASTHTTDASSGKGGRGGSRSSDAFELEPVKKMAGPSRTLRFTCTTNEDRLAVVEELNRRSKVLSEIPAGFYRSSKWGGFNRMSHIKPRTFESVFLKEGQREILVNSIKKFLDNEEAYAKVSIPYRMGILLHGSPGSGKSSTATAIANEFGIDVYYISLSSIDDDEALEDCFKAVPPRSVLILEDIDVVSAVKDRDKDDSKGITMSGMLNVLDGMLSNHGVITIMTTNRIDSIDDAIVRPGRIDLRMELDNIDMYQLENMCTYFIGHLPENLPLVVPEDGLTSADLSGVFRNHVPNFEEAESDVIAFVNARINSKESVR